MSIGKGLTYRLEQKVIDGTRFCDTPGLADVHQKKQAGVAIRESLNMGGPHKILFFCKMEGGRVNLADKTTMKLVHEAAKEIRRSFGVIVNQVSKGMLRKMRNDTEIEAGFREYLFEGIPETSHLLFLPNLDDLDAEDDALVGLEELPGLSDFLDQVPTIDLTPNQVKYIRVEEFDKIMERLEKLANEVQKLKAEKEAEKRKKGMLE